MLADFDLVGSFNQQQVPNIDSERTLNMFEYIDINGKKPKTLLPTPGMINSNVTFVGASGGFRASFVYGVNHYHVIGNKIWIVNLSGVATSIITLTTSVGYVGICADSDSGQILFVDGATGWVYVPEDNEATLIDDDNFPDNPIDCTILDGFFVVAVGGTNQFILSQLDDATTWTPLQQGSITSDSGTIVACRTLHRRLFLFSQNFTEVWLNAGAGTNLPFRRDNTSLMEVGCAAIGSVITGFDRMYFLSQDTGGLSSIMEVTGTTASPISTRAIDNIISGYGQTNVAGINDATSVLLKIDGIIFYRLNFTMFNHTFVYNVTMSDQQTKRWHEEEMLAYTRHVAQTHIYYNGKNYFGDFQAPILYQTSSDFVTNDGESIRRMRIGKPFCPPTYQRIRIDRFQIDVVQGSVDEQPLFTLADVTPIITENLLDILTEEDDFLMIESSGDNDSDIEIPSLNPVMYFSYSKDGGQSFGTIQEITMGAIGQRTYRSVIRKLGVVPRGQSFVPKIEFYSQIPFIILGAAWFYEIMPQ